MKLVSLFSCGGIGDYGFNKSGFEPVLLSDIDERRLGFANNLLPEAVVVAGDIRNVKDEIIDETARLVRGSEFALSFTPPCQGMSKNGIKTIMKYIKAGERPEVDSRNYLFMPCLEIINQTRPAVVFFENVPEAADTMLLIDNEPVNFIEYLIERMAGMGYVSEIRQVNFKDYGVPQSRRRLFGVFSRGDLKVGEVLNAEQQASISLKEAIGHLPPLDAKDKTSANNTSFHPLHKVPVMRPELYEWVSFTPEGRSALENNFCLSCSNMNSSNDLHCLNCGMLLNKPHTTKDGIKTLVNGYNSSYRRQRWDRPANTVTTRSAYASSAYNLHPNQNRVLSVYECAILQGLNPHEIDWVEKSTNRDYPDYILRDILGEAIPATFTEQVGRKVLNQLSEYTVEKPLAASAVK